MSKEEKNLHNSDNFLNLFPMQTLTEWQKTWRDATSVLVLGANEAVAVKSMNLLKSSPVSIPNMLLNTARFGLTSMNPNATRHTDEYNTIKYSELLRDLLSLRQPSPLAIFESYSQDDSWYEKGFNVIFDLKDIEAAQEVILSLGKKYCQVAVYKYVPKNGHLMQAVLPCEKSNEIVFSEVEVGVESKLQQKFEVFKNFTE